MRTRSAVMSKSTCNRKKKIWVKRELDTDISWDDVDSESEELEYSCPVCFKSFNTNYALKRHKRTHSDKKVHKCGVCCKLFRLPYELARHKKRLGHNNDDDCEETAIEKNQDKMNDSHCCPVCQKKFTSTYALTRHKQTHSGLKTHKCDTCGKSFRLNYELTRHQRTHQNKKTQNETTIKVCSEESESEVMDDKKEALNSEDPNINENIKNSDSIGLKDSELVTIQLDSKCEIDQIKVCKICQKTFTSTYALTRHMKIHTGLKPHQCDVCSKSFRLPYEVLRHKKIHNKDVNESLNVMPKVEDSQIIVKSENGDLEEIPCKLIIQEKPLKTEELKVENDSVNDSVVVLVELGEDEVNEVRGCPICLKTFNSTYALTRHKKTHSTFKPHQCNQCQKCFRLPYELQRHLKTHLKNKPSSSGSTNGTDDEQYGNKHSELSTGESESELHKDKPSDIEKESDNNVSESVIPDDETVRRVAKHKHSGPVNCDECGKVMSSINVLKRHQSTVHSDLKLFTCQVCSKEFNDNSNLKRHALTHLDSNDRLFRFLCTFCGKRFSRNSELSRHCESHGERIHKCTLCDKLFKTKKARTSHMKSHSDVRNYCCELCGFAFKIRSNLKDHMRTHSSERPYSCEICQARFKLKGGLRNHIKTHYNFKKFKCNICPSKFATRSALSFHLKRHQGITRHYCDACGKGFLAKGDLKRHTLIHSGIKPFECELCHVKFSQKVALKIHMKGSHEGIREYKCEYCPKAFANQWNMKNHIRIHTGEKPYKCMICEKRFTERSTLVKHKRTHINKLEDDNEH